MIINEFIENKIIKHGEYTLKSNQKSNIYIDLKKIVSYPQLNLKICNKIRDIINPELNVICGTPYGAVPFASYISIKDEIPMIFLRKEAKNYGTKKLLEGNFREGDTVILIEDVVTSGQSVIDTATKLEEQGLIVKQIITVFSRSNNKNLTYKNIPIEYLFHIDDIDMD